MNVLRKFCALVVLPLGLSACASIKIPEADLMKFGDVHEGAKELQGYPKITQAPRAPSNLRSDEAWDDIARELIRTRESFTVPGDLPATKTAAEVEREAQDARAKVHAYKKDDPQ